MNGETNKVNETAPVVNAVEQTPTNLTTPEKPTKERSDSYDYSYSDDDEEEKDGIIPTTEFDMKELAKTEHLQETLCGKKSFCGNEIMCSPQTLYCPGCKKNITTVLKEQPWKLLYPLSGEWKFLHHHCVIVGCYRYHLCDSHLCRDQSDRSYLLCRRNRYTLLHSLWIVCETVVMCPQDEP